jgi:hypothetical protein
MGGGLDDEGENVVMRREAIDLEEETGAWESRSVSSGVVGMICMCIYVRQLKTRGRGARTVDFGLMLYLGIAEHERVEWRCILDAGKAVDRTEEDVESLRCFGDVKDEPLASCGRRGEHRMEAIGRDLEEQIRVDVEVD